MARIDAWVSYLRGPKTLHGARAPLFIGGTGGSGTRVVAALVEQAGYFIGTNLHRTLDSLDMDHFCNIWLRRYLAAKGSNLSTKMQTSMDKNLERAVIWHRSRIPAPHGFWALKHPRTVLMLPYLQSRHPDMRFIHVVRDGRDMAFSSNTHQSDLYSDVLLPTANNRHQSVEEKAMRFWAHTNLQARQFADDAMPNHYRCLRLEDLCSQPEMEVRELFAWLGAGEEGALASAGIVRQPASLGRWRSKRRSVIESITAVGGEALKEFGYR